MSELSCALRRGAGFAFVCWASSGAAMDFKLGEDIDGRLGATVTAGTVIRMESADPAVLGTLSTARVGLAPGQLGGNSGGSDLNFQKGRPVSTVIKGMFDLELKRRDLGVFARAKAWRDFELEDGERAYGNAPNGFQRNAPLGDDGFDAAARFSNVRFADVYAFGRFRPGDDLTLDVRGGRQVVTWGNAQFVAGGIDAINPVDYPARLRPGALPQEGKVPVGMIYANLSAGTAWGVEGFAQYEFRPSVLPQCGTFFAPVNYLPAGCNYVSVLGGVPLSVDDASAFASGRYPKRNPDAEARDSGQFGASIRYAMAANAEIRAYAMNYHSRMPSIRITLANVAGGHGTATTTRLTDADGIKYETVYPEDIRLYGLSFSSAIDPSLRVFGELAYRPDQPVNLNASDVIATFLTRSSTAALNRAKNTNAIPPGGTFDAYDRFKVTTASLGANKAFLQALGSERLALAAEIGWSHVASLPDAGVLRYGRNDDYGVAAVDGGAACVETTAARKSCAHDGFVTRNAWGYRLRLSADYPGALFGATLTPSLAFAADMSGYSYDGSFLEDRRTLRSALRADWGRKYFAEIQYTRVWGGAYNTQIDRDTATLAVGAAI